MLTRLPSFVTVALTAVAVAAPAASGAAADPQTTAATAKLTQTTNALDVALAAAIKTGATEAGVLDQLQTLADARAAARAAVNGAADRDGSAAGLTALRTAETLDQRLVTRGKPMAKVYKQRPTWTALLADMAEAYGDDERFFSGRSPADATAAGQRRDAIGRLQAAAKVYRLWGYDGPDATAMSPGESQLNGERICSTKGGGAALSWAPPSLRDPIRVPVTTSGSRVVLDDDQDYVIDLGSAPVQAPVRINGGRNVVIVGGSIQVPKGPVFEPGLSVKQQAAGATVHIEGVGLSGPGLTDGVFLEQPEDVAVQVERVLVSELHAADEVKWSRTHPDVLQTDSGPDVLRVDQLSGVTPYQGLFLEPDDKSAPVAANIPSLVDLRNVDIAPRSDVAAVASMLLWQSTPFPTSTSNVWLNGGGRPAPKLFWPTASAWPGVNVGTPPSGSFATAANTGSGYCSPGYAG